LFLFNIVKIFGKCYKDVINIFYLKGAFFWAGCYKCWGDGIRNNQNIFRKIYINNSENNYKLSYTPKPLPSSVQSGTSREQRHPGKLIQRLKTSPQKNKPYKNKNPQHLKRHWGEKHMKRKTENKLIYIISNKIIIIN
jgi:hypothetical protein